MGDHKLETKDEGPKELGENEEASPQAPLASVDVNVAPRSYKSVTVTEPESFSDDQPGHHKTGSDSEKLADEVVKDEHGVPIGLGAEKKKKKKKSKSKSKMSKGAKKPTGFEEYYVDPPVTPEEFGEEKSLYDPSRPFEERIQTAIQRYSARRKFGEVQREMFDKYLTFGGIDAGPNMFGGGTDPGAEELDAVDIAQLKASKYVSKFVLDGEAVVDFDGVLKAFLSSHLAHFSGDTEDAIKARVHVVRNFLNYLLHHDVCPEYEDQIHEARRTCDTGEAQIWLVGQCSRLFPGDFNQACSTLFGGFYHDSYVGDNPWAIERGIESGMSHVQATKIFHGGLAAHGSEKTCDRYNEQIEDRTARKVSCVTTWLEVTDAEPAGAEVKAMYGHPSMTDCKTLEKVWAQTWHNPAAMPEDLTEEEEAERELEKLEGRDGALVRRYEFWVEEALAEKMFAGMKFEARVYELSFGVSFFDTVSSVLCSFFRYIPNIDMAGWREHRHLEYRDAYGPPQLRAIVPEDLEE